MFCFSERIGFKIFAGLYYLGWVERTNTTMSFSQNELRGLD